MKLIIKQVIQAIQESATSLRHRLLMDQSRCRNTDDRVPTRKDATAMPGHKRIGLSDLSSDDIAPLEKVLPGDCPDVWREFAQSLYLTLLRHPKQTHSADELANVAFALVQGIAQDLGGTQPYIPVGHFYSAAARAAAIKREFRGNNHRSLSERHGVSTSRVRQILAGK